MPKVIVVVGEPGSGKTSAIRQFLEDRGVFLKQSARDITLVIPIIKNGQTIISGITSAGDIVADVEDNRDCLKAYKCDVYVCAARLCTRQTSATYDVVKEFAQHIGAQSPTPIRTKRVTQAQVKKENKRVAKAIWQSIP